MLRIELRIEEGAIVFDTPKEVATISETLKVELESLKERNKTAIGRCATKQNENDCLRAEVLILKERNKTAIGRCAMKQNENDWSREINTSQRKEIKAFKRQIIEIESTNRILKADNDKLKQQLYVKYYPTDGQIKAEKERDELQTRLDILEARKAEAIEHLRL